MTPYFQAIFLFLFLASTSFGQLKSTQCFSSRESLCSTTYILESLGQFFIEGGCEGRSRISTGMYRIQNAKVIFYFQRFDSITPFFKIQESSSLNDTTIKVKFRTRYNNIIPDKYFVIDAISSDGKFYKTLPLNDNGEVFINPFKYKSLRLNYLQNFYGKWIHVDIKSNNMEVFLNFPEEFFLYRYTKVMYLQ